MDFAVEDHVGIDPGANLRHHVRIEIEFTVLAQVVCVARGKAVDERASDRDQILDRAGLEAVLKE